jgi:hypothetical protein
MVKRLTEVAGHAPTVTLWITLYVPAAEKVTGPYTFEFPVGGAPVAGKKEYVCVPLVSVAENTKLFPLRHCAGFGVLKSGATPTAGFTWIVAEAVHMFLSMTVKEYTPATTLEIALAPGTFVDVIAKPPGPVQL